MHSAYLCKRYDSLYVGAVGISVALEAGARPPLLPREAVWPRCCMRSHDTGDMPSRAVYLLSHRMSLKDTFVSTLSLISPVNMWCSWGVIPGVYEPLEPHPGLLECPARHILSPWIYKTQLFSCHAGFLSLFSVVDICSCPIKSLDSMMYSFTRTETSRFAYSSHFDWWFTSQIHIL